MLIASRCLSIAATMGRRACFKRRSPSWFVLLLQQFVARGTELMWHTKQGETTYMRKARRSCTILFVQSCALREVGGRSPPIVLPRLFVPCSCTQEALP